MSNRPRTDDEETRRLVVAITDFLREQLVSRTDFDPEDRDCLEIAIQSLEMAYGLDPDGYIQLRFARPLLDIFSQVTNPVPVKDKLRADAFKDEGNAHMRRSMYQEAESSYTSAIELDRWNSIYYCNRASARIAQQRYFEAISDCRQARMLNPDYAKAHAKMGQAYALLHRHREAARCFRQAVELDPNNERYRNNLRVSESQTSRPDAVSLLTDLLSSIFGRNTNTSGNRNVSLPSSFMIITESHPSRHAVQQVDTEDPTTERQDSGDETAIPLRYGVVSEGSEEQSTVNTTFPASPEIIGLNDHEFIFEFPFISIIEDDEIDNGQRLDSLPQTVAQENDTSHDRVQTSDPKKDNINRVSHEKENEEGGHESDETEEVKDNANSEDAVIPFKNVIQGQISNNSRGIYQEEAVDNGTQQEVKNNVKISSQGEINKPELENSDALMETKGDKEYFGSELDDIRTDRELTENGITQSTEQKLLTTEGKSVDTALDHVLESVTNSTNLTSEEDDLVPGDTKEGIDESEECIQSENKEAKKNDSKRTLPHSESGSEEKRDKNADAKSNNGSDNDNQTS